jgi:hypothetical protein
VNHKPGSGSMVTRSTSERVLMQETRWPFQNENEQTTWSGFLSKAYVCPRISVQSVFQEVVQYVNRLVSVQKDKTRYSSVEFSSTG